MSTAYYQKGLIVHTKSLILRVEDENTPSQKKQNTNDGKGLKGRSNHTIFLWFLPV